MWTGKLIRLVGRYDFSPLCMFKRSPISLQRTGKLIRLVGRKTNWCLLLWHESHKNQLIFESKHREMCFKMIGEDRSWENTFNNYISYLSGNCCLSEIFRMNVVEIPFYCFTNYKSNFRYHAPKFMQIYSKQYSLHTFMKSLKDEVRFFSKVL